MRNCADFTLSAKGIMDNKITKKRINDHLEYDWYKYLIIIIACIVLVVFVFSQINSTRDYEDVQFFVSCYKSSNDSFAASAKSDMNNADKYSEKTYGENVLLEINMEYQDPLGSEYGTLLQTHGMISSDVLIVGKSLLEQGGATAYVELTDELLNDYLLPKDIKTPSGGVGFKQDDLEYYVSEHNGKRYGIKVSDFHRMTGTGAYFTMDWRDISSYNEKYKDLEAEQQPDDEFYLIINPSSVNIGKFGKGKSKDGNAQALYLVNRFIAYYCYPYGF